MGNSRSMHGDWCGQEFGTYTIGAQAIASLHDSCINVEAELARLHERCEEIRIERDEARQHARIHGMQVATLQHEVDDLKGRFDNACRMVDSCCCDRIPTGDTCGGECE